MHSFTNHHCDIFNDIHAGKLLNERRRGSVWEEGLCISNRPRCDVISVSDTLRRKLIASVHVGDRFHVGAGK